MTPKKWGELTDHVPKINLYTTEHNIAENMKIITDIKHIIKGFYAIHGVVYKDTNPKYSTIKNLDPS